MTQTLGYSARTLLRRLTLDARSMNTTKGQATVYNARGDFSNLTVYRELEKAGKLTIHTVDNATTENMLYGMSHITFTLKGN